MNVRSIGVVLAALQLATSVSLYGVFWDPWRWFQVSSASIAFQTAMFTASLLFILLPIAAVAGVWHHRKVGWYALCGYPAIAWIFGTVPIPFASYVYSADIRLNSVAITIVNVLAIIVGIALLMWKPVRPNKSLHEPPGVSVTRLADATRAPDTGVGVPRI